MRAGKSRVGVYCRSAGVAWTDTGNLTHAVTDCLAALLVQTMMLGLPTQNDDLEEVNLLSSKFTFTLSMLFWQILPKRRAPILCLHLVSDGF